MSISFFRATYPCLLARIVYQVGKPAIFDGKRFLPLTGIPIPKMLLRSTLLADWEPEPLTVATWMVKSLTIRFAGLVSAASGLPCTGAVSPLCRAISPVAMWRKSLQREWHGKARLSQSRTPSSIDNHPAQIAFVGRNDFNSSPSGNRESMNGKLVRK